MYIVSIYSAGSYQPGTTVSATVTTVLTELKIWETEQEITNSTRGLRKDFVGVISEQSLKKEFHQAEG